MVPAFVVHSRSGQPARDTARPWRVFHSRITVIGDTLQHFGGLVDAQAAEEAQLDHLGFARCPLRQRRQGIVQGHEVIGAIGAEDGFGIERDMLDIRAALDVAAPRAVHEDAPHRLSGHRKEMGAILPAHALVVDQAQVGFVDQRGGLQAVAGPLALHVVVRQTVELVVDDRGQLGERALVPVGPRTEQRADVVSEPVHPPSRSEACWSSAELYETSPFLRLIAPSRFLRLFQ